MSDTLFSRIIRREIPADIIYEDELCLAFNDIHPQAPVHFLVIPKQPIASLDAVTPEDRMLVGHLFWAAGHIARERGFAEAGYRTVVNCNEDGGQTVYHLHVHVLAGKPLGWPPYTERLKVQS